MGTTSSPVFQLNQGGRVRRHSLHSFFSFFLLYLHVAIKLRDDSSAVRARLRSHLDCDTVEKKG